MHLSIDLVFSGTADGGHVETDPTDPVTVYGKTMVAAEEMILAADPQACILRISLPMGISFNGHAGRNRLDPIAIQKIKAGHVVLR